METEYPNGKETIQKMIDAAVSAERALLVAALRQVPRAVEEELSPGDFSESGLQVLYTAFNMLADQLEDRKR